MSKPPAPPASSYRLRLRDRGTPGRPSRRRTAFLGLAASAALVLAACGGTTGNEATDSDKPLVYGVFATPLEEPWDGAIHAALQSAADEGEIVYQHTDNNNSDDKMTRTLRDLLANEQPDIIFGDAFASEDATREVASDNLDTGFVFGSGEPPVDPNFDVFDNWLQDPAYLAGMLAGGITKSNTIGVVGAMPIPEVNRIVNAFIMGVQETNPAATVKVTFINSFFDPTTAKQAALAQVAQGADVLFAERAGVIEAAKEEGLPVIGMMVDQQAEAPQNVVTSLVWDMRPTVNHVIEQFNDGSLTDEGNDLGEFSFMKNGGSSLAPINTDVPGGVPQELIDEVEARKQAILDGDFVTPVDESAPSGSTTVGE